MNSGVTSNLLEETLERFDTYGYKEEDVSYVRVPFKDKKFCANISWNDFKENIKDINYDPGYGSQEISERLKIVFKDGNFFERREYDGMEWWHLVIIPDINVETVPFDKDIMYIKYERSF